LGVEEIIVIERKNYIWIWEYKNIDNILNTKTIGKFLATTFLAVFLLVISTVTGIQVLGTYHGGPFLMILNFALFIPVVVSYFFFMRYFKSIVSKTYLLLIVIVVYLCLFLSIIGIVVSIIIILTYVFLRKHLKLFKTVTSSLNVAIAVLLFPLAYFSYYVLFYTHQALFDNSMITVCQGTGWLHPESVPGIIVPIVFGWFMFFNLFLLFWYVFKKAKLEKTKNEK